MSERFSLTPNTKDTETDTFWNEMLKPDAPDEMVFQIDKNPGNPATFSQEAVDEMAEQFRLFLMARVYGHNQRTGIPARHLRIYTQLDWSPNGDPMNDPNVGPYFQVGDKGITPIDGTRRAHAWRKP